MSGDPDQPEAEGAADMLPDVLARGLVLDDGPGPAAPLNGLAAEALLGGALRAAEETGVAVAVRAFGTDATVVTPFVEEAIGTLHGVEAVGPATVRGMPVLPGVTASRDRAAAGDRVAWVSPPGAVPRDPDQDEAAGVRDTVVTPAPGARVVRLPVRTLIIGVAIGATLAAAAGTLVWRASSAGKAQGAGERSAVPAVSQPAEDGAEAEPRAALAADDTRADDSRADDPHPADLPSMAEAQGDDDDRAGLDPPPASPALQPRAVRRAPRRSDHRPVRPAATPGPRLAPEDLLASANTLRGQRQWAEAERTYRRVLEQYPSSAPAYVAAASAGALRLERMGDARGALALLQDARRAQPQGPLDPELRLAIAEAFIALGRKDVARRELIDLADVHPSSPQAATARRRLGEL